MIHVEIPEMNYLVQATGYSISNSFSNLGNTAAKDNSFGLISPKSLNVINVMLRRMYKDSS
jgi:hypothetical protein